MDALPDPAVIWRPVRDAGGAIVAEEPAWVNRAYVALAGLDATLADALALAPPGRVWTSLHAVHGRALGTGRAERTQVRLGSERILETESIPLGDGTILVAVRDVTAERRAAAILERSLRGLAEAQRIAGLGSWSLDPADGAMTWSDEMARIHGLPSGAPTPDRAAYLAFVDGPAERARLAAAMERTLGGAEAYEIEHGIVRADGVHLRVVARGELGRAPEDGRVRLHGTVLDITERVRAREARTLRVVRRADYLAQAAHVLRTELALVAGWSELLADPASGDAFGEADRRQAVTAISRSAPRLARLVDAILDEAAETARAASLEPVPVDVAALAAAIVHEHGGLRAGVTVRAEPESGVSALAAPDALGTVVRHLLENALRHTRSTIVVGSARTPDGVTISVRDDGPGLPPGSDPFRPFLRGADSAGHGLGLHVVRTLTEGMGGRVRAVPHPPGTGAEIVLVLPPAALADG
ncbi:MAG: ATP-binding protein [Chloroflexota bacterium]